MTPNTESITKPLQSTGTGTGGKKRVVVIGGGFAGLYTAKHLGGKDVEVVLIDRKNHHTFQPLLYQVATTVLSPGQIASPLRHILHHFKNVEVILGEVVQMNLDDRNVVLANGITIGYDYLVVAAGARHSYFGNDQWEHDAPGLKTLEDAVDIRRRILKSFEDAEREAFLTKKVPLLTFAIVGGGPTGVELAGAIADIARRAVRSDYKAIDTKNARIILFEGSDHVLSMYPDELSASAEHQLTELGVEVHTKSRVTQIEPGRLMVNGEWVPVCMTLWATGVAASPLAKLLGVELDRAGRAHVQTDLSIAGRPEVFVLGDMAAVTDASGKAVPGLGAAAMQEGKLTAHNILRDLKSEPRKPFTYLDKGTMATIGRHRAVAHLGPIQIKGFIAWLMWAYVHVFLLIGFRNRLSVMREWIWAYFTGERSARLITGDDHH